jgi:hypothetical protein
MLPVQGITKPTILLHICFGALISGRAGSDHPRNAGRGCRQGLCRASTSPEFALLRHSQWTVDSDDTGKSWHRAPDLIPVAIDDIRIAMPDHELVLGSYGRGLIIGKLNPSLLEQSGE